MHAVQLAAVAGLCDNGAYCTLAIAMQPCPAALPGSLAPAALQKYYSLNNRP
jgi:hypothetical protein